MLQGLFALYIFYLYVFAGLVLTYETNMKTHDT